MSKTLEDGSVRISCPQLDHSQEEEMKLALEEGRQPRCVYCGEKMDTIGQTQFVSITWTWNEEAKRYDKDDSGGDSAKAYCGECEAEDWAFTGNELADY